MTIDPDKRCCDNCGNGYLEFRHYYCECDKNQHNALDMCDRWFPRYDCRPSRIEKEKPVADTPDMRSFWKEFE